ncbi:TolC family outer membrane protein [Roseateles violae]|uniref:TolC family outer membrane protein n=1 Tax=Roseateles violae TaxID=3058042 RepID=A0ABT8DZF9_9BURK|nr:TolC family outer membrane protein [Pelomonas sp. PFR6]MDN3922930.1 TolC family outer membrane protein [Pelomonas sp. PFR6]
MKRIYKTARWAVLTTLVLQTCAAQALDLVGAYEQALRHDPAKLAANEALAAGREKAVQGDSLLKPRVGLQAGYGRLDNHSSGAVPPALSAVLPEHSSGTVRQAVIQLSQPIYDATARAEKRQLQQQARLAETEFDQAQQTLAQRVAEAYFGVLQAQENLRVTLAEKAAIAMQRERAQARFDVGRGKATDLQEARARYDQILSKEINARSLLELRRAQFEETTGAAADGVAALAPGQAPTPPEPDNLLAWQLKGEDQSTAVRVRRSQLEIAIAEIEKHKMSGRPSLSLVASYAARGQNGGLSPLVAASNDRNAYAGLQFNLPLYAGGALDSREREAQSRRREAEQELAAAKRDVRLQVQDAYLSVRTGVPRIAAAEQSLLSARTALEATTLGRDVGTRTELDVLDVQQRAFAAEFELVQARLDYLLGRVRLAAAAGELGEQQLRELNSWLAKP